MSDTKQKAKWVERLNQFIEDTESIRATTKIFGSAFPKEVKRISDEIDSFIEEHAEEVVRNSEGKIEKFRLDFANERKFKRISKNHLRIINVARILPDISIVNLICLFDGYLADVLKSLFVEKNELAQLNSKNIVYSDLVLAGSLEQVKDRLLDNEVEAVLRGGWDDQAAYFSKILDWDIKTNWSKWDSFYELIQTRNIIVHNNGAINQYYVSRLNKHTKIDTSKLIIGEKKFVTNEYITNALSLLQEISIRLTTGIRNKIFKENKIELEEAWADISYDLLVENKWRLIIDVLSDVVKKGKYEKQSIGFVILVNYCIASIRVGDKENAKRLISTIDVSAMKPRFIFAKHVLLEEFELAARMVDVADIDAWEYREWPLVKFIESNTAFLDAFKNKFNEEYSTLHVDKRNQAMA